MTKEQFSAISPSLPHQPGCYKYYDAANQLLYVGKAKDLKKRISSYFVKNHDNYKTKKLVTQINSIDFTVTDTEHDAFLLENSLIKHFQPPYNISLKDDKTYPYIVIKKEPFPRVFFTRRVIRDGSEYLGPFTGLGRVKELMDMIKQSIPLRTCSLNLTPANIAKGKFKVCLEYHIGNCKGPCAGFQSEAEYKEDLNYVRHVLKGNLGELFKGLRKEMDTYAANLQFEKAQLVKKKMEFLQGYESKSVVVNPRLDNLDVVCIIEDQKNYYVNYMMISKGSVLHSKTLLIQKKLDELQEDVLALAADNLRTVFQSNAEEMVVPMEIPVSDKSLKVTVPKAGDKKQLLELAEKNARVFAEEIKRRDTLVMEQATEEQTTEVLVALQKGLHMQVLPDHIECFDNSNFQGAFPVAAMVCFKNGVPSKKDYRHFHIKTVEGINDFASMSEIVLRRYKRLQEEGKPLPKLVIIDGGKGQLGAAMESLEKLGLLGQMVVVGLAKREESVFFPGDSNPIQFPYDSPENLMIRRIRDEVHRFGITFHRDTRSKGTIKNQLEDIPGIGEKTAAELLKLYKSVNKIKTITERELTKEIGASKARLVYRHLHPET